MIEFSIKQHHVNLKEYTHGTTNPDVQIDQQILRWDVEERFGMKRQQGVNTNYCILMVELTTHVLINYDNNDTPISK